jgi:transposase
VTHYIGFDIHKRYTYYTRMAADMTVVSRGRIENSPEAFSTLLADRNEPVKAAMESTFNWYYLYDLVAPLVDKLTLVVPAKLSAFRIERIKTDRRSADLLAQLTCLNLLPAAYVPPREIRDLRELLRYRAVLVKLDTMLKNRVHGILHRTGHRLTYRRIFGKQAQATLATLPVGDPYPFLIQGYLAIHTVLENQQKLVNEKIKAVANVTPEVQRLMSLPQVSYYTALLLYAEIGDVHRFPSAKHLASYAGMVPSLKQSGESLRQGRITKQGSPWLRWILIEAAHRVVWASPQFRQFYHHVARRKGEKTATIAVAHKLLRVIYYMLRHARDYEARKCG